MKNPFAPGDVLRFTRQVQPADKAQFDGTEVHPVYATFALARDAQWSGRLFVLEMKEEDEEGIGTGLTINHHAPALVGQEVVFEAILVAVNGREVVTRYEARVGARLIASGEQKQQILKKEKLERLFSSL